MFPIVLRSFFMSYFNWFKLRTVNSQSSCCYQAIYIVINFKRCWLQLASTLTEFAAGWGSRKDLILSVTVSVSGILFHRKVSDKEYLFVYLFLTNILGKYVSGILFFSQKLIFCAFCTWPLLHIHDEDSDDATCVVRH